MSPKATRRKSPPAKARKVAATSAPEGDPPPKEERAAPEESAGDAVPVEPDAPARSEPPAPGESAAAPAKNGSESADAATPAAQTPPADAGAEPGRAAEVPPTKTAPEGPTKRRRAGRRAESGGAPKELRVRHGRLHSFVRQALTRSRLPPELASQTADALVGANLAGWDEDGATRLPEIVDGLSTRHLNAAPRFRSVASSGGTAVLDGDGGPGPAVAHRAMTEAISAANRHGVGAVAVRGGNRFGAPGHFARLALPHQMIGLVLSSGPAPPPENAAAGAAAADAAPGGYPAAFGLAIPTAENAPPLVLNRWLGDAMEASESDLELALALEALTALAGAATPGQLTAADRPEPLHGGTGQLFLAFRVRAFAPWGGFRNRMVERLTDLRRRRLLYPGQTEGAVEEERRTRGIPLERETAAALERLAHGLDLHAAWEKAAI